MCLSSSNDHVQLSTSCSSRANTSIITFFFPFAPVPGRSEQLLRFSSGLFQLHAVNFLSAFTSVMALRRWFSLTSGISLGLHSPTVSTTSLGISHSEGKFTYTVIALAPMQTTPRNRRSCIFGRCCDYSIPTALSLDYDRLSSVDKGGYSSNSSDDYVFSLYSNTRKIQQSKGEKRWTLTTF